MKPIGKSPTYLLFSSDDSVGHLYLCDKYFFKFKTSVGLILQKFHQCTAVEELQLKLVEFHM